MLFIRSLIFHMFFYTITTLLVLLGVLLVPLGSGFSIIRLWARINLFLLRVVVGLTYEIRGKEHIPQKAALIAAKHQSAWETFALIPLLKNPVFVIKQELAQIPLFGWYAKKMGMIPVDTKGGKTVLISMLKAARACLDAEKQLVIFPEGTRTAVDAKPNYRYGIVRMFEDFNCPCTPVALNTALFWPPNAFYLKPGKILVTFLPPILPGKPPYVFKKHLITAIETETHRLIEEGRLSMERKIQ